MGFPQPHWKVGYFIPIFHKFIFPAQFWGRFLLYGVEIPAVDAGGLFQIQPKSEGWNSQYFRSELPGILGIPDPPWVQYLNITDLSLEGFIFSKLSECLASQKLGKMMDKWENVLFLMDLVGGKSWKFRFAPLECRAKCWALQEILMLVLKMGFSGI